jgi:hypothetical protein
MEIGLFFLFLGACCIRKAKAREPADDYPDEYEGPGVLQRIRNLWRPCLTPPGPDNPIIPKKEETDSRLQIRQELDKDSQQMLTRISYREKGRRVSVKYQGNMTLQIAGLVLQLDPTGLKAQEVQKKEGGGFVRHEEHAPKGREANDNKKGWPIKAVPRVAGMEGHGGQDLGEEPREDWSSF